MLYLAENFPTGFSMLSAIVVVSFDEGVCMLREAYELGEVRSV